MDLNSDSVMTMVVMVMIVVMAIVLHVNFGDIAGGSVLGVDNEVFKVVVDISKGCGGLKLIHHGRIFLSVEGSKKWRYN